MKPTGTAAGPGGEVMIKSIKNATDVLTILSASPDTPVTLKELSAQLGMNKSTCAHILDTLCESFYVEHISRKEGYRLGPWAYMLSRYGRYQNNLVTVSVPLLKWLHKKTDATVFISVVCNGKKYIPYHIDKANILPMSDGSIIQGHLETTATGLLLMANMDSETLRHILAQRKRAGDLELVEVTPKLLERFRAVRDAGYCSFTVETPASRSYAFGVESGGKIIAAIGILYPLDRDRPEYRAEVKKLGRMAAKEISRRLTIQ